MSVLTIETPAAQLLSGLPLDADAICRHCKRHLPEGTPIRVSLTQTSPDPTWENLHVYCRSCHAPTISSPTCGVAELVADATVATHSQQHRQRHCACLADPEVRAFSAQQIGESRSD